MTYRVSPGVYPNIIDDTIDAQYINPSIAGGVGAAVRGPLGLTFVSSYKRGALLYGTSRPSWGHFLDSMNAYLLEGTQAWFKRVVSADATYGMNLIANNKIGGLPAGTSTTEIPLGSEVPYDQVNRDIWDIELTGTFVSDNQVNFTINTIAGATVSFATDHNTTVTALRQALQNTLDGIAPGGYVWIVPLGTNSQLIRIISPQAITLALTMTITGTTHPTADIRETDWLSLNVSENPGGWCSPGNSWGLPGVAVGIANVDVGIPERKTLSFSAAIITGNTISAIINGITVTANFTTDNNTTLQAFATAYVAAFPGGAASVVNNGSNDRQIILVAPDSKTSLTITSLTVTGGTSQALATYVTSLNATPTTGGFNFVVYENPNFVQPDELFSCTVEDGIDGLGNPTGFAYVVNSGPRRSPRVRVIVNPLFSGTVYSATSVTNSNKERFLTGGLDGSLPSTQQVVQGWSDFEDPEKITVRILINCGYATPEVHQAMIGLASRRMDCFAICDTPSDQQSAQDAVNYRNNVMNVSSFWGAIYSPDVLIYDSNMGARRYIPPSGLVACQYAYTDRVAAEWFAPAGLTRGLIQGALALRETYNEGDRDLLSQAQVNAIRKFGAAFPIWGEYTLQQATSSLQSVPVVRLTIRIITEAANVTAYSVFEPNNPYTWHRITTRINAILQPILVGQGLEDYWVQCNDKNNTADVRQARICKVAVWYKPVLSILYIRLDAIVTRLSATFTVEAAAALNQY